MKGEGNRETEMSFLGKYRLRKGKGGANCLTIPLQQKASASILIMLC